MVKKSSEKGRDEIAQTMGSEKRSTKDATDSVRLYSQMGTKRRMKRDRKMGGELENFTGREGVQNCQLLRWENWVNRRGSMFADLKATEL